MRKRIIIALLFSLMSARGFSAPPPPDMRISIGVYNFPPVASVGENQQVQGFLGDILSELTSAHQGLDFQVFYTSPQRRHMDFEAGLFDIMFFESPGWSWQDLPVQFSKPYAHDVALYVALKKPGRDQSFFDNVGERNIVAISGFHYGFAGLSTNNEQLQKRFNIEFSHSHRRNLNLILADRPSFAEVAILSRSFLHTYSEKYPDNAERLLISTVKDLSYQLHIVARENGAVTIADIESMLHPLVENRRYQGLVRKHGLQLPDTWAASF